MRKILQVLFLACSVFILFIPNEGKAQKYCYPSFSGGGCGNGDSIISFIFGTYTRKSGCFNSAGIDTSQLTKTPIVAYRGKTYYCRINVRSSDGFAIFIDYNKDGDFSDPGEFIGVDNAGADSFKTYITIPEDAKLLTTRMRIYVCPANTPGTNSGSACATVSSGGEIEDYPITISAYSNDVALLSIYAPQNYACASSTQTIKLVVKNMGTTTQTIIPVVYKVGTTTVRDTIKKSLAIDKIDTFTFTPTVSMATAGTYTVKAYTNLSGDQDRTNDTIATTTKIYAVPNSPSATNVTKCGYGTVTLKATASTTGTAVYWYKNATTDTVLNTGDTLQTPFLTSSKTYYVQSQYVTSNSLKTTYTTSVRANVGNMFDVKTFTGVTIDSFNVHTNFTGSDSIAVYYKKGTYVGSELIAANWKLLGKTSINGKGAGYPVKVNIGGLQIPAGQTYGIFIWIIGGSNTLAYDVGNNYYSNNDIAIQTGNSMGQLFGTSNLTPSRNWNGEIFYHFKACTSNNRIAITATIKESVTGTNLVKGSPFKGVFAGGTAKSPDAVCSADTINYDLIKPTKFTNAGYGTTWTVKSVTFTTAKGYKNTDFKYVAPTSTTSGKITFYPKSTSNDSTYVLAVVVNNIQSGCDSTIYRTIYVAAPVTSKFTASNFCINLPFTPTNLSSSPIGVGKLTYVWYFGNGDKSTKQSPSYYYSSPGTYTVSLAVSGGACRDSTFKTIIVYPSANGASFIKGKSFKGIYATGISTDPDLLCVGDSAGYEITPPTALKNSDFPAKWNIQSIVVSSPSGNFTDTVTTRPTSTSNLKIVYVPKSNAAGQTVEIKVVLRATAGTCDSTLYRYISVGPKPKANFGFIPVCIGKGAVQFLDSSTLASGILARRWDFGDGSSPSTFKNVNHTYAKAGKYTVTLTASSDKGCTDVISKVVDVYSPPKVNFGAAPGCVGLGTNFFDSTITQGNITSWLWKFGDGGLSTTKNPSHIFKTGGTFNVKLIVDVSTGCRDSVTKSISVISKPVAGFNFTAACQYSNVVFTNTSTAPTGNTITGYKWDFGDGVTSTDKDPKHPYTNAKTYPVRLIVTASSGCVDTIIKNVTLYPNPAVKFGTGSRTLCKGVQVIFSDSTVPAGTKYEWSFGDGTPTLVDKVGKHTYANPGNYDVWLKVTSDKGCPDSAMRTITVNAIPKASFTAASACAGTPVSIVNNSTSAGGATYFWQFGDKSTSTDKDPQHTYTSAGSYAVKLKVTNVPGGCTDSASTSVTVYPSPTISFKTCNVTVRQVAMMPSDSNVGTYRWYFGDGDSSNDVAPLHTYNVLKGKFEVKLIVSNQYGCTAEYTDTACVGSDCAKCITGINETMEGFRMNVYPNPFSHSTNIHLDLEKRSDIALELYDMMGRKIKVIDHGMKEKGLLSYEINPSSDKMLPGAYLLKVRVGENSSTRQLIYTK